MGTNDYLVNYLHFASINGMRVDVESLIKGWVVESEESEEELEVEESNETETGRVLDL